MILEEFFVAGCLGRTHCNVLHILIPAHSSFLRGALVARIASRARIAAPLIRQCSVAGAAVQNGLWIYPEVACIAQPATSLFNILQELHGNRYFKHQAPRK